MDQEKNDIRKLGELIKGSHTVMFTTVDSEGRPHSRPMTSHVTGFDGTLWFLTNAHSLKITELERDHEVSVSYVNHNDSHYVSVSGKTAVVKDPKKIKDLWSPVHETRFPEGPNDPNITLLKVKVERAEYWDSLSSPGVYFTGFDKVAS